MRRPRPERGERRIDAATDHLARRGFAKPQIRRVINELLQVYGGREGWPFLEEGSYGIVRHKLVEQQAQQDQKQEAAAAEETSPQKGMKVSRVHGDAPNGSRSALEQQPSVSSPCYGWINEASETESESEPEDGEILSDAGPVIFVKKDTPNPVETLPSKKEVTK